MFEELGGLFGWILIIDIIGTMLNYCIKFINKRFGKKISASPAGKKIMTGFMTVFVRNHKYFGISSIIILLAHFIVQFSSFGVNITGGIAALVLIFQSGLGIYAIVKKKPRHGAWFIAHRAIAVLFIFCIALHLILPYALNLPPKDVPLENGTFAQSSVSSGTDSDLPTFTLDELSIYNGENGNKAYVAYNGLIYDITGHQKWRGGKHNGNIAGTDLTSAISRSPHGDSKFKTLEIVGKIK